MKLDHFKLMETFGTHRRFRGFCLMAIIVLHALASVGEFRVQKPFLGRRHLKSNEPSALSPVCDANWGQIWFILA